MSRLRPASALAVVGLVLTLATTTGATLAAFTSTTSNTGSTFSAAATFCPSPGSQTVGASEDAFTKLDSPDENRGNDNSVFVKSDVDKVRRGWVKFALPAIPSGCTVTSAVLRMYARTGPQPRTVAVYRAGAAWSENAITWNTEPPAAGTAVTASYSAPGWLQWTVTAHVIAQYAGSNFGFTLRDDSEGIGNAQEDFNSSEAGSDNPELTVTYG